MGSKQGLAVLYIGLLILLFAFGANAQKIDEKAQAILAKAVQNLGGDRYLQVRSQVGKGRFSLLREGGVISSQTFVDIIVFPDKERTDFKGGGQRTVQTNSGNTGWIYDDSLDVVKVQNETQIANFKQSIRTSLDYLLRGSWKGDGELTYVGRRPATLGKRNDVVKLTYKDGFVVGVRVCRRRRPAAKGDLQTY